MEADSGEELKPYAAEQEEERTDLKRGIGGGNEEEQEQVRFRNDAVKLAEAGSVHELDLSAQKLLHNDAAVTTTANNDRFSLFFSFFLSFFSFVLLRTLTYQFLSRGKTCRSSWPWIVYDIVFVLFNLKRVREGYISSLEIPELQRKRQIKTLIITP